MDSEISTIQDILLVEDDPLDVELTLQRLRRTISLTGSRLFLTAKRP
jgi:hypothetical protein